MAVPEAVGHHNATAPGVGKIHRLIGISSVDLRNTDYLALDVGRKSIEQAA
ncbi:MAG TPA: hypothetical protein VJU54_00015 [Nitrospiraceae bacterium]|nr:hypothetical protein [Nitrospiraceae bacterium]